MSSDGSGPQVHTGTPTPGPGRHSSPLAALGSSAAVAAAAVALGYASWRWAATGLPLEPLPGPPWPYLAVWGVFCLAGCLLWRWATAYTDPEGGAHAIGAVAVAGMRTSLAHRPDVLPLWLYGALVVAACAGAAGWWRGRVRRATADRPSGRPAA
ncbi:hypothetical protein [Streptomyces antimicrobicus]|uniref:Tryptophan-rich sensory protein n=1 Tax=Streptomyces antimicrobicus TaxID=2883108 RepID=A0ABS8B9L6_9ACTN|nr:hypothetical protein [Streptomyces antimicrobicus]MCB5181289.1 hypothetical protein [Streptomyces antimicrobicus]